MTDNIQSSLASSERRLDHLLSGSSVVIYTISLLPEPEIIFVSNNSEKIIGYKPEEIIGNRNFIKDIVCKNELPLIIAQTNLLYEYNHILLEYRYNKKNDDATRWIRDEANLIRDESGNPFEIVGSWQDVTAKKDADMQLLKYKEHLEDMVAEKTKDLVIARDNALSAERTMSGFLSNMSHELRTPLHGILSFSEFGVRKIDTATKEKLLSFFEEINSSGRILLKFVNDLLDMSKLKAGKSTYEYDSISVTDLIDPVVSEYTVISSEKNIGLNVKCNKSNQKVILDVEKIRQVIRNILSNAVKGSESYSKIEIEVIGNQHGLTVTVTDQGLGIPEDEIRLIFDPFYQSRKTKSKAGGTGLGLAICEEIVNSGHGGEISVSNLISGGVKFMVSIPNKNDQQC